MSRIIIIDDSQIFRFTVKKMLSFSKYTGEILEFENGRLALDYLQENKEVEETKPNYILLDLNMPVMSGFEFLVAYNDLLQHYKNVPISILSSSIDQSDKEQVGGFSFVKSFFTKPLNPAAIQEIMANIV